MCYKMSAQTNIYIYIHLHIDILNDKQNGKQMLFNSDKWQWTCIATDPISPI